MESEINVQKLLMEELFLRSCANVIRPVVEKVRLENCVGCRTRCFLDFTHTCRGLWGFEAVKSDMENIKYVSYIRSKNHSPSRFSNALDSRSLTYVFFFRRAAPYLLNKTEEVLAGMKSLTEAEPKFRALSLMDFLEFACHPHQSFPFARLSWDGDFLQKLMDAFYGIRREQVPIPSDESAEPTFRRTPFDESGEKERPSSQEKQMTEMNMRAIDFDLV